jgi:hypothetical protein
MALLLDLSAVDDEWAAVPGALALGALVCAVSAARNAHPPSGDGYRRADGRTAP